jgi:serine protease Do
VTAALVWLAAVDGAGSRAAAAQTKASANNALQSFDQDVNELAKRIMPAVVQVVVTGFGPANEEAPDQAVISRQSALGSGVIVDPNGYIMTNAHVVAGAQRIKVLVIPTNTDLTPYQTSFATRQRTYAATLVGISKMIDLALLKIDAADLPCITLRQAFHVELGQTVLAIGSPLGLDHTITRGIVSSVARQPEVDRPMVYIQTDAPINPGNSGGALVDRDGNLVGLNTFILSKGGGSEGLGFAIPEPAVRYVYQELKQFGRVRQNYIGADVQTITSDLAAGLQLPQDWGVVVADVVPGGPAERTGLHVEDIVLAIDGRPVDSLPKFWATLYVHPHDRPVRLDILRGKDKRQVSVAPIDAAPGFEHLSDLIGRDSLLAPLGVFVVTLSPDLVQQLPGMRSTTGVIVAGTSDRGPAVDADLAVGDVIRSFNRKEVSSVEALHALLDQTKPGEPVVLQVERQGALRFVSFETE